MHLLKNIYSDILLVMATVEKERHQEKIFKGKIIYFSGAITEKHPDPDFFKELINFMKENGALVLSEHVGIVDKEERTSEFIRRSGIRRDLMDDPSPYIREADLGWVHDCTNLIAVADTPSTGAGMEIQEALNKHKMGMNLTPVLCLIHIDLWKDGFSNMVKGISKKDSPVAQRRAYLNTEH